jgi:hypothetical protein
MIQIRTIFSEMLPGQRQRKPQPFVIHQGTIGPQLFQTL